MWADDLEIIESCGFDLSLSYSNTINSISVFAATDTFAHMKGPSQRVFLQNQHGNQPLRWEKTGTVMELGAHDDYVVRGVSWRGLKGSYQRILLNWFLISQKPLWGMINDQKSGFFQKMKCSPAKN